MDRVKNFLEFLKRDPGYSSRIMHIEEIPGRKAEFRNPKAPFPPPINSYLSSQGIPNLYSHQVEAIEAIREGRNVIVTAATGSGKSLIYNLSVWEAVLKNPETRALYIFPTKALTQDQLTSIKEFTPLCKDLEITADIYDGDTSASRRVRIKKSPPHIVLTNPDMLQMGILPFHSAWREFLSELRFVVLDELHTYRGVFGTHVAHIMRRMKRILALYGSKAQFIASSATIDTPEEFARNLTGEEFRAVKKDGAPSGKKHFVLWESEASSYTEATNVFIKSLDCGLKTILFTKARRITELVSSWIKEERPDLASKVASYRAGYLPSERREIEADLFGGKLAGVVSTSALELGIDVGELDCCVLLGYPGSIVSTWQRSGRVGRGTKDALVIMIGLDDALDQYLIHHPQDFFSRGWEKMIINLENKSITHEHLPCAAAEHPLSRADATIYGDGFSASLASLEKEGQLLKDKEGGKWYPRKKYPQRDINIRSIGQAYSIIDLETGRTVGDVDETRLYHESHPGAIYLHRSEEYEIVHLNQSTRCVYARKRHVDYYTKTSSWEEVEILKALRTEKLGASRVSLGEVRVTEHVTGFEKYRKQDRTLISEHSLSLPKRSFETVSLWLEMPSNSGELTSAKGHDFAGVLHAAEHATIAIFPLKVPCDRQDIGGYSFPFHVQTRTATIFIYDAYPGGVGLAERAFDIPRDLFQTTLKLIRSCRCQRGCPSCIQSPRCGSGNKPLDKEGAIFLLDYLLSTEPRTVEFVEELALAGKNKSPGNRSAGPTEDIVFFDLETQKSAEEVGGWDRSHLMRVSVAVTCSLRSDEFQLFTENRIKELLDELFARDLVVGFNVKRFDYRVLSYYTNFDDAKIPTLDIHEIVMRYLGFPLSLERLSQATLGYGKTGNGLDAIRWFREGRTDKLAEYCSHDVKLVKELYEFGKENDYLLFEDKNRGILRIPVSWG